MKINNIQWSQLRTTNNMSSSIIIINIELFEETEKGLTLLGVDFGSTHSSMFQCNWNLQSFHHLLYS